MSQPEILLQLDFLMTTFEIDRLKVIWCCQNTIELDAQNMQNFTDGGLLAYMAVIL